jgi:hypothetical protein
LKNDGAFSTMVDIIVNRVTVELHEALQYRSLDRAMWCF